MIVYQCVLSTRYDLAMQIWAKIENLHKYGIEASARNVLVTNFLNTVFVIGAAEFEANKADLKALLVQTRILFRSEMMKFILKQLKHHKLKKEINNK